MSDKRIGIGMVSAFMMAASSAVCAAEGMTLSEYYKTAIMPKESGVYEYQEILFVHSRAPYESRKLSAKIDAKFVATVGIGKLLRTWAIDLTAPDRAAKETLSEQENQIKYLLDSVDNYWRFPDWQIEANLQWVIDEKLANEYVIGVCGQKTMLVSSIPETYKIPCTRDRIRNALPGIAKRRMQGSESEEFMRVCGAWDLVNSKGALNDKTADFENINDDIGQYIQNSSLSKALEDEIASLSVPQIVTNKTSVMNEQGTMLTEKTEVAVVTRFPRMQKLFLNHLTETNFSTARLASGTIAIESIHNPKVTCDERVKLFRLALCDSPGDKDLWNFFGRLLMAKNDNLGAIICFRNALRLDNRFVYPIVNLACAYKMLGKNRLALGTAIVGRGLATDVWSMQELDKVLWGTVAKSADDSVPALTPLAQSKTSAVASFDNKATSSEVTVAQPNIMPASQ